MKKNIHPPFQEVLFVDSSTGTKFICGSTLQPEQKEVYEGKEYPVFHVSVSSASHPFFTGSKQFIDTEGRVDKFLKRYAKKAPAVTEEKSNDQESSGKDSKEKNPSKKGSKKK